MGDPLHADLAAYAAGLDGDHDDPDADAEALEPPANVFDADRLMRRIRHRERELAELAAQRDAAVAPIVAWHADRSAGVARDLARSEAALEAWMRAVHSESGGRRSSQNLPHGVARLRALQVRGKVSSPETVAMWCESVGVDDVVTRPPVIDMRALRPWLVPGPADSLPDLDGRYEAPALFAVSVAVNMIAVVFGAPLMPERVPGVTLEVPTFKSFSYTTNKGGEPPTPEES